MYAIRSYYEFFRSLLRDEDISAVLVPRRLPGGIGTMPTLVAEADEFAEADPLTPSYRLNSARILTRLTRGAAEQGMVAAVLRPCEISYNFV